MMIHGNTIRRLSCVVFACSFLLATATDVVNAQNDNLFSRIFKKGQPKTSMRSDAHALSQKPQAFSKEDTNRKLATLMAKARKLEHQEDFDKAVSSYQAILKINSQLPFVHHRLAVNLDRVGKSQQASVHYQKASQLGGSDAELHCDYGYSLYLQGKHFEAAEQYQYAIQLNPNMKRAFNNLGILYAADEQNQVALNHFVRAGCDPIQARSNLSFGAGLTSAANSPSTSSYQSPSQQVQIANASLVAQRNQFLGPQALSRNQYQSRENAHQIAANRAEANRAISEQVEAEQFAAKRTAANQIAIRQAAYEQAEAKQLAARKAAYEQAEAKQLAARKAAYEQATREQAAYEQAAYEQATREQAAYEQAANEQAANEQAAADRTAANRLAAQRATANQHAIRQAELQQAAAKRIAATQHAARQAAAESARREQAAQRQTAARQAAANWPADQPDTDIATASRKMANWNRINNAVGELPGSRRVQFQQAIQQRDELARSRTAEIASNRATANRAIAEQANASRPANFVGVENAFQDGLTNTQGFRNVRAVNLEMDSMAPVVVPRAGSRVFSPMQGQAKPAVKLTFSSN